MIVGICADGTSIKPGVAIPRKTEELKLMENGYTPDKISITYHLFFMLFANFVLLVAAFRIANRRFGLL